MKKIIFLLIFFTNCYDKYILTLRLFDEVISPYNYAFYFICEEINKRETISWLRNFSTRLSKNDSILIIEEKVYEIPILNYYFFNKNGELDSAKLDIKTKSYKMSQELLSLIYRWYASQLGNPYYADDTLYQWRCNLENSTLKIIECYNKGVEIILITKFEKSKLF